MTCGGSYNALLFTLESFRQPFHPQLGSRRAVRSKAVDLVFDVIYLLVLLPPHPRRISRECSGHCGKQGVHSAASAALSKPTPAVMDAAVAAKSMLFPFRIWINAFPTETIMVRMPRIVVFIVSLFLVY